MGGRGGRGGGGGRGRGGKSKQDYSDVPPIDYSAINKQTYKQIDGSYTWLVRSFCFDSKAISFPEDLS